MDLQTKHSKISKNMIENKITQSKDSINKLEVPKNNKTFMYLKNQKKLKIAIINLWITVILLFIVKMT